MRVNKIHIGHNFHQSDILISNFSDNSYEDGFLSCDYEIKNSVHLFNFKPEKDMILDSLSIELDHDFEDSDHVFINGYQSWSFSKEYSVNEKRPSLTPENRSYWANYKLNLYGDYDFVKEYHSPDCFFHSHNYTYIRRDQHCFFYGSLSEEYGFTIFNFEVDKNRITIIKDVKGLELKKGCKYNLLEIFINSGQLNNLFNDFFSHMDINPPIVRGATGWTSWYNHYENINENIILNNLHNFSINKIPIDFFQVDDGYETSVGDWLDIKDSFPGGMKNIREQIHSAGYKAGLWLAPFICERESPIFKEHPDWILRDENNQMVLAGTNSFNWKGDFFTLNIFNHEVKDYLKKVFNTILYDWGFDLLKLDFLYAVAIIPHNGMSRGRVLHHAMTFLRSISNDKILLGCGVPLGSAYGLVDYCRIGCDIGPYWEDHEGARSNYQERISTFNSLRDSISRYQLNNRAFLNDPDVFIIRGENNELTESQRKTNFLVNQIFGEIIFTSDDISTYDSQTMDLYLSQFPSLSKSIKNVVQHNDFFTVYFTIEEREYFAVINLTENEKEFLTDNHLYFNKSLNFIQPESTITIEPYSAYSFLKVDHRDFQIIGSYSHIFPGSEVDKAIIKKSENDEVYTIKIDFNPHMKLSSSLLIKVPDNFKSININGKAYSRDSIKTIKNEKLNKELNYIFYTD